jgi:hypothetical protein
MNTKNQIVPGAAQQGTQAAQGLEALMNALKPEQTEAQPIQYQRPQSSIPNLFPEQRSNGIKRMSPMMSPQMRNYGNSRV